MKTCIQCGEEFKPQGRQKVCGGCKNAMQKGKEIRQADEREAAKRPVVRRIIYGGAGVIMR